MPSKTSKPTRPRLAGRWPWPKPTQTWQTVDLPADSLAYTLCQVPVVHLRGDRSSLELTLADGRTERFDGLELDLEWSRKIFRRSNEVTQLTVTA